MFCPVNSKRRRKCIRPAGYGISGSLCLDSLNANGCGSPLENVTNLDRIMLGCAVHPVHGLAWTDGRCVFLLPLSLINHDIQTDKSNKLGEFEQVRSLHWSVECAGGHCYLCVVHTQTVSLWRVEGRSAGLSFKQVRKIHAAPIAQGCLWNPNKDILCILNREQCSFYFRHVDKKGSFSLPPIESGKISCGCWCLDGKRLVVGIGSIVLIYQWADIDTTISQYTITAWKIPNVDGKICAVNPLSDSRLVCSAELPLEALCRSSNHLFDIPDDLGHDGDAEDSFSGSATGNEDEDYLSPGMRSSFSSLDSYNKETLLRLPRNARIPTTDYSQLVLFELRQDDLEPVKISSTHINGILSPDLLQSEAVRETVVVGSNSQNVLQVFKVNDNMMEKLHDVTLSIDERPKGLSGLPGTLGGPPGSRRHGVLLMVGRLDSVNPAFLPSSLDANYKLQLRFQVIDTGKEASLTDGVSARPSDGTTSCLSLASESDLPRPTPPTNGQGQGQTKASEKNSKVHLLRFSSLKESCKTGSWLTKVDPDRRKSSSTSHVNRKSPGGDSLPARTSSGSSNSSEPTSKFNLLLPGRFFSDRKAKGKKIELLHEETTEECELQTEAADFSRQLPLFANSVCRTFSDGDSSKAPKDQNAESSASPLQPVVRTCADDAHSSECADSTSEAEERLSLAALTKHCTTENLASGFLYDSTSSVDLSQDDSSGLPDSPRAENNQEAVSALDDQILLIEKQILSQEKQISRMQTRVVEITRLLEDTTITPKPVYRPVNDPEIVYLIRTAEDGTEAPKAFVLDHGRLQLESVKRAFDLDTVELIIDGVSCVLGANTDGYMPITFQSRQTLYVTGKPALLGDPPGTSVC